MVSVLPTKRSPFQLIGQAMTDLGKNTPELLERRYQRGQLQNSLDEIKNLSQQPGTKPLDLILSAMKAGAGIPGSERYLGQLIPELAKFAQAGASQNVPLPGENRNREPMQPTQSAQQLPNFLNQSEQPSQFFPTNLGPQGGPGNLPRPATTGEIRPIPNRSEQISMAKQLSEESTAAGIPLTVPQALEQVKQQIEDDKINNELVEKERQQRVTSQKEYGQRAAEELLKQYPEATSEQQAIFQKYGEQEAAKGKSESDINRSIAKKAEQFKNSIANVKKSLSAPRLQNKLQRAFEGTYRDIEQASADLRSHLKPILDLGLYDTARNLLTDLGYYPEERESIINPLSEHEKIVLNKVPEAVRKEKTVYGAPMTLYPRYDYAPDQLDNIKQGLKDLKQVDPNFSVVLARKAFEDKKYDWQMFKDAFNQLEEEGFELTDDQKIQKKLLDTAPLNDLQKFLQGINIIGR